MKIIRTTVPMRRVQGETYTRFMGVMVCTADATIHDFQRTTWRLGRVPIWRRDHDFVEVPVHVFIAQCLGTGQ